MTSNNCLRQFLHTELIHKSPKTADPAANIIAKQWKHNDSEIKRNLKSMLEESRDNLPCHLALILNIPSSAKCLEGKLKHFVGGEHCPLETDVIVGHVKLSKADGRSDGACCISYSLVVDDTFRGHGFGRVLTEEAENYARSIGLSYMYLSTDDKVSFYEHLGYKQCEAVSSLGNNSKRLNANQVSALEGLFAKRLNVCNPCDCNIWLRKRLIESYTLQKPLESDKLLSILTHSINDMLDSESLEPSPFFVAYHIPFYWQQQTGPSCGIAAMNMVNASLKKELQAEINPVICSECSSSITPTETDETTPLSVALNSGVSNDGELFCAYNYQYVAGKSLHISTTVLEDWTIDTVLSQVSAGYPIIVPYDRGLSDHKPGEFKGSQAHWLVVIGFIIPSMELGMGKKDQVSLDANSASSHKSSVVLEDVNGTSSLNFQELSADTLVICTHGMSRSPFVCTFKDLYVSNKQLLSSKSKFYLASEDLKHLRSKIVVLNHDL